MAFIIIGLNMYKTSRFVFYCLKIMKIMSATTLSDDRITNIFFKNLNLIAYHNMERI